MKVIVCITFMSKLTVKRRVRVRGRQRSSNCNPENVVCELAIWSIVRTMASGRRRGRKWHRSRSSPESDHRQRRRGGIQQIVRPAVSGWRLAPSADDGDESLPTFKRSSFQKIWKASGTGQCTISTTRSERRSVVGRRCPVRASAVLQHRRCPRTHLSGKSRSGRPRAPHRRSTHRRPCRTASDNGNETTAMALGHSGPTALSRARYTARLVNTRVVITPRSPHKFQNVKTEKKV